MGEYEVIGGREYRGHPPGTVFEARIARSAAARAIQRGDIRLLRIVTTEIQPGSFKLPEGWGSKKGRE